jgi:hypothetical protein
MGRNHAVGGNNWEPEPACSREHRMSLATGPELGVEILRSTEPEYFFEKTDIAGEQDKSIPI